MRIGRLANQRGDDLFLGKVLGVGNTSLERFGNQPRRIVAVKDEKRTRVAHLLRVTTQDAVANMVERARPQGANSRADQLCRAFHHLACGTVGKG